MSNNFKYTMQKHRGKLWVGGSLLVTALAGGGVWLVVSEDSPLSQTKEVVNPLAEQAIMAKSNGAMDLVRVKTGESIAKLKIDSSTKIIYQASHDHEELYTFNGDELARVSVVNDSLHHESLMSGITNKTPTLFATDAKTLAFYSEKEESVTITDIESGESQNYSDVKEVRDMLVTSDAVFYLTDSELVQVKDGEEKRIEIGSSLTSLQTMGENIVVHSTFGQEKGENIILYVNAKTLDIENLQKTGSINTTMLTNDDNEEFILVGNMVDGETPSYIFNRYKEGNKGLEKDKLTLRVPTETADDVLNSKNSVVDSDYIYIQSDKGLRVFDVKSQAVAHEIPIQVDYAMPIIHETGGDSNE